MSTRRKDSTLLMAERPGYECGKKTTESLKGWDNTTKAKAVFEGGQARPYLSQTAGSPKACAKSGARSIHAWQRDYNTKGVIDEKVHTLRYQRVVELKRQAIKEAERRNIEVEAVEEEMYQAQRAASKRIDTGLRKDQMQVPFRTHPVCGGPPKLFDGSEPLEEHFSLKDARDMFRGEAWETMSDTLSKLDNFKPAARSLEEAIKKVTDLADKNANIPKASFSTTPSRVRATQKSKEKWSIGADCLVSLKKLIIRKYGTVTSAWRHGMDFDGNGRLAFAEWSKALRHMGFEGDIKETFRQQDYNNSGIVTFAEFDPEMAAKMKEFKHKVLNHFLQRELHNDEDWNEVWAMIDENRNNKIESDEFAEVCATIGYEGDPIEMFRQLRSHPSRKLLHVEDFKAIPKGY